MEHEINNLTVLNETKQIKHLTPWGKDAKKCRVALMGKHVRGENSRHKKITVSRILPGAVLHDFILRSVTNSFVVGFNFHYLRVETLLSV